jgi:hypothetical protein
MRHVVRGQEATSHALFDDIVSGGEQLRWYCNAERFRRLEIDGQFEFGRLNDGNVAWLRAPQNLVGDVGGTEPVLRLIGPVGHQPPSLDKQLQWVDCW